MPSDFYPKAIQTMNYLSYHAPVAVRSRMKETLLSEVRNTYVVRCLLYGCWDLETRISIISEIGTSIENLVASGEAVTSRVLLPSQVLTYLLSTFVEAMRCEGGSDGASSIRNSMAWMDVKLALLAVVRNCVSASTDCRKSLTRLVTDAVDSKDEGVGGRLQTLLEGFQNVAHNPNAVVVNAHPGTSPPSASSSAPSSWWSWSRAAVSSSTSVVVCDMESAGAVSVGDLESCEVEPSAKGNKSPPELDNRLPMDSAAFLRWYNEADQEDVRASLWTVVARAMDPILQLGEKLRDRTSSKQTKFAQQQSELLSKERTLHSKLMTDALARARSSSDERSVQFEYRVGRWVVALVSRVDKGATCFHGSLEDSPLSDRQFDVRLPQSVVDVLSTRNDIATSPAQSRSRPHLVHQETDSQSFTERMDALLNLLNRTPKE